MTRPPNLTRCRSARRIGGVLVAAAAIVACNGGDDEAAPTTVPQTTTTVALRADDGVLKLGVFLPRTGPGASLGEPMIDAVAQAVQDINAVGGVLGEPVLLEVIDENSETGLRGLVESQADAIVGPASSTVALSQLDEIAQQNSGVVTCSPTATSLALDDYPDNKFFFRTIASDSLQMAAIAKRVAGTGVGSVTVGYLDDVYGRGLADAFAVEAESRAIAISAAVPVDPDREELDEPVAELLASAPGVIVVLGDADDGTRLLLALDTEIQTEGLAQPEVIVNDALRNGRQTIQGLSSGFRDQLTGVAPLASSTNDQVDGFFTANAVDCVNLIALAAVQADSDSPREIQALMAAISSGGRVCVSFADCVEKLGQGLQIDYNGPSGGVELSSTTGDLVRGWFEAFGFDEEGIDVPLTPDSPFQVP